MITFSSCVLEVSCDPPWVTKNDHFFKLCSGGQLGPPLSDKKLSWMSVGTKNDHFLKMCCEQRKIKTSIKNFTSNNISVKRIRIRKSENLPSKRPDIMYIYDKQSGRIHRNHPKHSNPENRCFHYVRPQKSPKIAQKTDHSIAICSTFLIGMVYFGWYLVNHIVQTVQNMHGKGG